MSVSRFPRKESAILPRSYKSVTLLAWLAVLLASAELTLRGPLRASSGYINDFAAPYVSTRLWLQHRNPYDAAAFFPTWHQAGAPQGPVAGNPSGTHPVYPPPIQIVLAPFALLPWPVASKALILASIAFYLAALLSFASFIPGTWQDPAKPLFLAFGLALAPAHSALHVTNLTCLAASLLFLAIYLLLKNNPALYPWHAASLETSPNSPSPALSFNQTNSTQLLAVILAALAICLKPTIGLLLIPYLLWTRAWRTLTATGILVAILSVICLYPLLPTTQDWLPSFRENLASVFARGGVGDIAPTNLTRFDLIDLQLPLYALVHSRTVATAIASVIALCLLLLWFKPRRGFPQTNLDDHLLRISALLIIGLLPFYQRYYSALLVLLPSVWAFRNIAQPRARWVLALCAVFLVNTEVLQQEVGLVPPGAFNLPLITNAVIGPHLCWLLLVLATLLVSITLRPPIAPEKIVEKSDVLSALK